LAPIVLVWLVLAPTAVRAQDEWFRPGQQPSPAMIAPLVVRGQDATNYAPPDPNLPLPLGSTRPECGLFLYGEYAMYAQTNPLKSQVVAYRGILDILGQITGTPNNPINLQRKALDVEQVTGPQSQQPGFKIGIGYRFDCGSAIELSWLHLNTQRYTAVATPIPSDFKLRSDLSDSFLFAPVNNFPLDFAGPFNDTSAGPAFGIWNGADVMTEEYTQRNEIYELVYRLAPVVDTLDWRTYGLFGFRAVWFWERYAWRTSDLDVNGASSPNWEALYSAVVSNRLYGVKIGCGNDWYLGNGFSCNFEAFCTPMLDIIHKFAKYERGDRNIGPENKRADHDYHLVPEVGASLALNWFPYEGIQVKLSYNFMGYFNTEALEHPVDFDYSQLVPDYTRLFFRQLHGFELGVMFRF